MKLKITKKIITNVVIGIIILVSLGLCINSYTDYKISKAIQTYQETTTKTINFK